MAFFKSKTEKLAENLYEEQLYAQAAVEIAEGNISPGLWAKAFAETQGDEHQAKAVYIKLRVEQLQLGVGATAELLARYAPPPPPPPPPTCSGCGTVFERMEEYLKCPTCGRVTLP